MSKSSQVKVVGSNGQLSLGKAFAGKMVLVNQVEVGTWIIKVGNFIPDSEQWLYDNPLALKQVKEGLEDAKAGRTSVAGSFAKYLDDIE